MKNKLRPTISKNAIYYCGPNDQLEIFVQAPHLKFQLHPKITTGKSKRILFLKQCPECIENFKKFPQTANVRDLQENEVRN